MVLEMILSFRGVWPTIAPDAYVAPTADVIGDVVLGSGSSLWFGTVARGDSHFIRIGERTNVQDRSVLHVTGGQFPLVIGDDVSIAHGAIIHGCTLGNRILIGMGATVLDGVTIGDESIVGAGAVVAPGTVIAPRSVLMGLPARCVRRVTEPDLALIRKIRDDYRQLVWEYRA